MCSRRQNDLSNAGQRHRHHNIYARQVFEQYIRRYSVARNFPVYRQNKYSCGHVHSIRTRVKGKIRNISTFEETNKTKLLISVVS